MLLNLSDKQLSKTHNLTTTVEKGFMFKDLNGNPMMIPKIEVKRWTPKTKGE